jgi:L-ascorbate metabolism protein UlaG (beta-lactamase superfamily)
VLVEHKVSQGPLVRITFYGHACFRLEGSGLSVVTDPYTPQEAGLAPVPEASDVVVMSSALDSAHSCWQQVPGSPQIVNALDAVAAPVPLGGGVEVRGIPAMEGEDRPDDPKANALYTLALDGVRVCHMGDVGNPLDEGQLTPLRDQVDVLLALAGRTRTIALPDLDRAIEEIRPRVVIPMHYRTPRIRYQVKPVEDFLARHEGERVERPGSTLELEPGTLPEERTITVLTPLLG